MGTYQDLWIWKRAMGLAVQVYRSTGNFPRHELYGLVSQMRRAAVSVPSNIAEGKGRSDKEFNSFLLRARGSLLELETQIMLARQLEYLEEQQSLVLLNETAEIGKGLNALINKFRAAAQ